MLKTKRLKTVFENLNPKQDVWDFCCDHGYLGAAAYKSQNFSDVYFVDQVDSIMQNLKTRFMKYAYRPEYQSQAHFICQSGESIGQAVTGTVSITGVGGLTIYQILQGLSQAQNLKAQRLILGPHKDDDKLLDLIARDENLKGYQLQKKTAVIEGQRSRNIFVLDFIC